MPSGTTAWTAGTVLTIVYNNATWSYLVNDVYKRFLNREFRQVWAVHRETGERVFLARGQADAVRAVAKKEWRCPVPGCVTEISTRGKSRRDHFFHVNGGAGHSDGESEWHLQAKAMVADTDAPVEVVDKTAPIARIADAIHAARAADLWVPWTTATATRTGLPRRETASAMARLPPPTWSRCASALTLPRVSSPLLTIYSSWQKFRKFHAS